MAAFKGRRFPTSRKMTYLRIVVSLYVFVLARIRTQTGFHFCWRRLEEPVSRRGGRSIARFHHGQGVDVMRAIPEGLFSCSNRRRRKRCASLTPL